MGARSEVDHKCKKKHEEKGVVFMGSSDAKKTIYN